jgi:amino acid transporter
VLGTHGYKDPLDKIDAPLNVLAVMYNVPLLSPLLSAGAMFSFFALASSCMNAGARVMFAMGRHDFFYKSTSSAHKDHGTPHVALAVMAIVMFAVVTICKLAFKLEVLDEFNDAGTMGAFGFLGAYFFITLAAPAFLKKRNELKATDVALCVAAVLLMLIPAVGSVYPVPPAPVNIFPYIFGVYLFVGFARTKAMRHLQADRLEEIRGEIAKLHAQPT